jgi:hypothetical protein
MIKKSFFENAYAYINAQFDTDFESAEKDAKHASKKVINEKVREKLSFLLLLLCAKFFGF